jgi:uncharacterized protein (TIGR02594 family)
MTMPPEPQWMAEARSYNGEREIKGREHNPLILRWWALIHAGFSDDETPWCAAFVGGILENHGIRSSRSARARSYLTWGRVLDRPVPGCIAVLERGPVNGHVGFVTGITRDGRIVLLGGNQGDEVNESPFEMSRVIGWRWPESVPIPYFQQLPVIDPERPTSRRESFYGAPRNDDPSGDEGEGKHPADFPVLGLPAPADTGTSTRFKHITNFLATGAATGLASLLAAFNRIPVEVVIAICATGLIVFAIIWFTSMRRGCHSGR